jgi:hypothetical protein
MEKYKAKHKIEKKTNEELKKEIKKLDKKLNLLAAKVHVKIAGTEESEDADEEESS